MWQRLRDAVDCPTGIPTFVLVGAVRRAVAWRAMTPAAMTSERGSGLPWHNPTTQPEELSWPLSTRI